MYLYYSVDSPEMETSTRGFYMSLNIDPSRRCGVVATLGRDGWQLTLLMTPSFVKCQQTVNFMASAPLILAANQSLLTKETLTARIARPLHSFKHPLFVVISVSSLALIIRLQLNQLNAIGLNSNAFRFKRCSRLYGVTHVWHKKQDGYLE